MHVILLIMIVLVFIIGPQYWVKYVLKRYHRHEESNFTGTGGELAEHLLEVHGIQGIKVETTNISDHYDPLHRAVRLTPDKFHGKTLTAIVVAAHECGHAIQHHQKMSLFQLRTHLAKLGQTATTIGSFLLFAAPFLAVITRAPAVALLNILGAFLVLGFGIVIHLITLPVEFDASFNKALPILQRGYLNQSQMKAAQQILKAAAFTYVAGSLASLLNFWRWFRVLKR